MSAHLKTKDKQRHLRIHMVHYIARSITKCALCSPVFSDKIKLVGHTACMGETVNAYKFLSGKQQWMILFGRSWQGKSKFGPGALLSTA
jgi:hypothetical protein